MSFRFLDHTADVQVELHAKTPGDLFCEAARALYAITLNDPPRSSGQKQHLEIHAENVEELLVRWLQELIYFLEVEHVAATDIQFGSIANTALNATCLAAPVKAERRAEEVKSATYHDLVIEKRPDGYMARITLDL